MKNIIYILLALTFISTELIGQQVPFTSQFSDSKFVWNPAFAGADSKMRVNGFVRQQWLGVEGAPRSIFASIEYPFIDYNMSAGAVIFNDDTGPISKTGIQLMYNYKMKEILGRDDQFSIGIQGNFSQFAFNSSGEQYNDTNDPLISGMNASKGYPTLGAGFAYISDTEEWDNNTSVYIGGSFQQVYSSNLLVNDADFSRESHTFFNVGAKVYTYDFMFEPFINFNYTSPELLNYSLNFVLEAEELFWAGIGYSNTNELSLQGGYILDDFGSRYSQLKLGVLANIIPASNAISLGPGFEFFISYNFDMD